MLWLLAASLSIILVSFLPSLVHIYWLFLFSALALLLVWHKKVWHKKLFWLTGILCGLSWSLIYANLHLSYQLPHISKKLDVVVRGTVCSLPQIYPRYQKFLLCVTRVEKKQNNTQLVAINIRKILLYLYQDNGYKSNRYTLNNSTTQDTQHKYVNPGEQWQFSVRLKPPHGTANPSVFMYEEWLFENNIDATGYIRTSKHNKKLGSSWHWQKIRQSIKEKLQFLLQDNPHLGIITALTIGDKSALTDKQWQVLTATGTSHLLAISGLHIGLVAFFVFYLINFIGKFFLTTSRISASQVAAIIAMFAAVIYAVLAGLSLPTQRAIIMLAIWLVNIIFKTNIPSVYRIIAALFVVLVWDPLAAQSASFWLSFVAISTIIFVTTKNPYKNKITNLGYNWFNLQWKIFIGLLPLVVILFGQIALLSPFVNLVAIPYLSFIIIPLCLFATCLLAVPYLNTTLFHLINYLLDIFWTPLEFIANLPVTWQITGLSTVQLILLIIASFLLLLPKKMPLKTLVIICIIPLWYKPVSKLQEGEFNATILDVGQGLSVFIRTATHNLIYDVGAKFSLQSDAGKNIIVPFLHSRTIYTIDGVVLSHADNDHIGGLDSLIQSVEVKQIISGQAHLINQTLPHYKINYCYAGTGWKWDSVEFIFLHPQQSTVYKTNNNNSCVLKITSSSGRSLLLTGDITAKIEGQLIKHYGLRTDLHADVLLAPHHGSKTSSSKNFIAAVSPQYVIYSAGYLNQYFHPHPSVSQRYKNYKTKQLNTATHGAISTRFLHSGLTLTTWRHSSSRKYYWHQVE